MTIADLLIDFGRLNLAAAAAVGVIALVRKPVRQMIGANAAYALWATVPLIAAGALIPARKATELITDAAPVLAAAPVPTESATYQLAASPAAAQTFALPDPWMTAAILWAVGVLAALMWVAVRQRQALAALKVGDIGPAVVGVLRPRIVTPPDFEQRFAPDERELVLAHEQTHIQRHDAHANALVALAQCLCWFNPLIHLGAHLMRIDQEMACDAQTLAHRPKSRRIYAEALLKAQLAANPLPLGCYWPAGTLHPLAERIAMLKATKPSHVRRIAGGLMIAGLAAGGGLAAWAAQPKEITYVHEAGPSPTSAESAPAEVEIQAQNPAAQPVQPQGAQGDEALVLTGAPICLTNACGDAAAASLAQTPYATCEPRPCRVEYVGSKRIPSYSAFATYFNGESPQLVRGRIGEVRFQEGALSELVVQGEDGRNYRVTGGDVANLTAEQRTALQNSIGADVVVRGYSAFDTSCEGGGCIMNGRDVTRSDGTGLLAPIPASQVARPK